MAKGRTCLLEARGHLAIITEVPRHKPLQVITEDLNKAPHLLAITEDPHNLIPPTLTPMDPPKPLPLEEVT